MGTLNKNNEITVSCFNIKLIYNWKELFDGMKLMEFSTVILSLNWTYFSVKYILFIEELEELEKQEKYSITQLNN